MWKYECVSINNGILFSEQYNNVYQIFHYIDHPWNEFIGVVEVTNAGQSGKTHSSF